MEKEQLLAVRLKQVAVALAEAELALVELKEPLQAVA